MENKRYTCIRLNTFLIKMSFDLHIGKIHWVNIIVVYYNLYEKNQFVENQTITFKDIV